jgi:hypothetical protein
LNKLKNIFRKIIDSTRNEQMALKPAGGKYEGV